MGGDPDAQAGLAAARWNHDDTGASPEADWQAVTDPEASGHSGFQPLTDLGLIAFRDTADELTARAGGTAAAGGVPTERGYSAVRAKARA